MIDIFAVFLIASFVSAILYFECRKYIIQRGLSEFPAPKHVPIIGVANRFIGISNDELLDVFNEMCSEVPRTPFQAWFGYILVHFECDSVILGIFNFAQLTFVNR